MHTETPGGGGPRTSSQIFGEAPPPPGHRSYRTAEECLQAGLTSGMRVTAELRPGRRIEGRLTLIVKDGVCIRVAGERSDTPCVMPPWRVWLTGG